MFSADFSVTRLAPELKSMYLSWHRALEDGSYPRLASFGLPNTENAPNILSVFEIERSADGAAVDFKVLYARCRINNTLHEKYVGTRLSEHEGCGPGSKIWSGFAEVARQPRPLLVSLPYVGPLPDYGSTSEIYLPLLDDRGYANYVLAGVVLLEEAYRGD